MTFKSFIKCSEQLPDMGHNSVFLRHHYMDFTLQHWKHTYIKQKSTTKASPTDCTQTHALSVPPDHSFVTAVTFNPDNIYWIGMPEIFKTCSMHQDKIR